jgi:hypothetical protein
MPEIDLPPYLVSEIENGNVVLMLGAGASFGTTNARGQTAPMAAELAKLIANKFLSPVYADKPLGWVANYAISEASLVEGLAPSPAHKILTTFRWRAIVTTNYDMLIEDAYTANKSAPQKLVPLLDDDQNFDAKLRDPNALPLLKLHGCITQTRNAACPLVLSADSYIDYETKRSRLFHWFRELASQDQFRACAVVHRYGELGHDARPVFDLLLRYAVSEEGALHAEKYYQTVSEEFAFLRLAFRWRELTPLARVTTSEYGYPARGYAEACKLLRVS